MARRRTGRPSFRVSLVALALVQAAAAAPRIVPPSEWGSQPQPIAESLRQVPSRIVVHHAGVRWTLFDNPPDRLRRLQSWGQREKGWPDLPYHYLVAPNGLVYAGRDPLFRPESNTDYPLAGVLNVELCGNFEEQPLPLEQLRSLVELLADLCRRYRIDPEAIQGHCQAAPGQTVCPGAALRVYLEDGRLQSWIQHSLVDQEKAPFSPTLPR